MTATLSVGAHNWGNVEAGAPFVITVYSDAGLTRPIGSATITAPVGGCGQTPATATIPWANLQKGDYPYWVKVDSSDAVAESDESDNVISGTVHVDVQTLELPLAPGWNLIAIPPVPFESFSTAPSARLGPISGRYNLIYGYEGCDSADPWKKYNPTAPPPANDLTALDAFHGYWLRTTEATTLTVTGNWPGSVSVSLCPGWNLIGYPAKAPVRLPDALAGVAGKYDLVWAYVASDAADPWKKYNPSAPAPANDLWEMGPGKGYWLRMTAAATLTVGP